LEVVTDADDVDVAPLANLKQLQELAIDSGGALRGLQAVLSGCTGLRCLKLGLADVVEQTPLYCPSLQELWLSDPNTSGLASPSVLSCGLDLPGLPSLQKVCVYGVLLR
jgi:hypothetical protein